MFLPTLPHKFLINRFLLSKCHLGPDLKVYELINEYNKRNIFILKIFEVGKTPLAFPVSTKESIGLRIRMT